MRITEEQLTIILKNKGLSLDFKTSKETTKRGFLISIKDTETTINNISCLSFYTLLNTINTILQKNTYNRDLNINNILGFWINNDTLYIDVSKCINVKQRNIYLVKNEAIINNQYEVYNNATGKSYKVILPIYTIYNTHDLLHTINNPLNYSIDCYNTADLLKTLGITSSGLINKITFSSIDDIPESYNFSKVIIKDTSNYTRDMLDIDANLTIEIALKFSKLIEAENTTDTH